MMQGIIAAAEPGTPYHRVLRVKFDHHRQAAEIVECIGDPLPPDVAALVASEIASHTGR